MGKTLAEFRTVLRTDLKDSSTLWSDAELDRSISRAVSDLSRFMPLEKVYEATIDTTVTEESFTSPATSDDDYIVDAKDISASVAGNTCTLAHTALDVARPVLITITDANASITAFTIIVKGIDVDGHYEEESFYFRDGLVQTGKTYFKYISEVEIDAITGNGASDVLDVGTGSHLGVFVSLANKPIKPKSETVTTDPSVTTYARDTDFTMDYINGRIALKSGGSMSAGTGYLASYTKSRLGIDVSSIIAVISRIVRVEYPVDRIPQQFVSYAVFGDFMYVGSQKTNESQSQVSNNEHIAIYYEREHTPPSLVSPGSYPAYLDQVISIGAGAYALMIKSLQYEHQAVTDLVSLRGSLTSSADIVSTVTDALAAANTALDNVDTYLAGNTESTAALLAQITTDIASLRTAISDAQDASNSTLDGISFTDYATDILLALNKIPIYLENNSGDDAGTILASIATDVAYLRTAINTALDAANSFLDETDVTDFTGTGDDSAEAALKAGEDFINAITTGANVASLYAEYSRAWQSLSTARTNVAIAFEQEGSIRLDNLRTYIEQGLAWVSLAKGFADEATARISLMMAEINKNAVVNNQAAGYITEAESRINNLRTYIEQANAYYSIALGFVNEAVERNNIASRGVDLINSYVNVAGQYAQSVSADMLLSDRFKADGVERLNEFYAILKNKAEYRKRLSSSTVHQPA